MTGLDRLISQNFSPLRGLRVGLVTHPAALAADGRSSIEVFQEASGVRLAALFGPEHGLAGTAQDLIPVRSEYDSPLPVHSLYGDSFASLKPTAAMLEGLDALVVDMQDVGARYYTFQATMLYCMQACAEAGLPLFVLDRPNPIGRVIEGPTLQPGFESFIGPHPICIRHGMTLGELARLYQAECTPKLQLEVIRCETAVAHDFEFVLPPSPNMPRVSTALVYPGMCLIEGTNLSEGRGTTRPFEFVGHPDASPQDLARRLHAMHLPDVRFLPIRFEPTFHKHAGKVCGGVCVQPLGPAFQPVRTGLAVLIAFRNLLGEAFQWRTEEYEFVDHIPAIDLLFGSSRERTQIDAGQSWQTIAEPWRADERDFLSRQTQYRLYH